MNKTHCCNQWLALSQTWCSHSLNLYSEVLTHNRAVTKWMDRGWEINKLQERTKIGTWTNLIKPNAIRPILLLFNGNIKKGAVIVSWPSGKAIKDLWSVLIGWVGRLLKGSSWLEMKGLILLGMLLNSKERIKWMQDSIPASRCTNTVNTIHPTATWQSTPQTFLKMASHYNPTATTHYSTIH